MPWKNGGGSTTELAVFPPQAGMEDFVWRLSRASVHVNGPFSDFPQVDRSLAILSGDGLILHGDSERKSSTSITLTSADLPYQFAGETPIFAELCSGPVVDLNLMTRRDICQHFMQKLTGGEHYVLATDAQQLLLYCAAGNASVTGGEPMQTGDLILKEEEHERGGIDLHVVAQEGAVLYLMRISFLNQGEGNHGSVG